MYSHLGQVQTQLLPDVVLNGYRTSFFPMAESDGTIYWHSPDPRAVIPLDSVRVSKSLRKTIAKNIFEIRFDCAFYDVICACCERSDTWINSDIIRAYTELHERGFAHSVESWIDGELVGGLYGVAIGGAYFGESMFSRVSDASKVAFVALTQHLLERGFTLLDSQYINSFTEQLGAIEISRDEYLLALEYATQLNCRFA
ncbi:MAG: leucyl/phenylalanyl-tRNA--protein transferase [Candidatus Kapabacteria bacterium]|nr:leucyl/phenylalanyl-tRNA--protein transferase [Candidatus Kapabacteria bacterium]MBX7153493.1 leucyl/phenylalanyl-tRNA--protein transferase [Bacteroidota bacterium]